MAREVTVRLPEGWEPADPPGPSVCCYEHWQKTKELFGPATPINPDFPVVPHHPPYMVVPMVWDDETAARSRAAVAASGRARAGADREGAE